MVTLTYLQVHIFYNLPPLILFGLLYRPFASRGDLRKFLFLTTIAVIYTTPWDNYIIYRKAWQYCPTCVLGTIGLVPIEEYIFFVTQTILTCLIQSLLTRCFSGLPALGIRRDRRTPFLSLAVLISVLALGLSLLRTSWDNIKTFYIRAILLWVSPVLIFLFAISGIMTSFTYYRSTTTILSILLPTLYLWLVDSIAITAGTWHINEATSLEIFVWEGLPIEEAIFFLVTNAMVVLGCNGFDLAFSIVHTYNETVDFSFASLCRALLQDRDEQVIDDLAECVTLLRAGSSSFYSSSFFFNEAARRDLVVLYAFCRFSDDVADDTDVAASIRRENLAELTDFVNANFLTKTNLPLAQPIAREVIEKNNSPIQRSMLRYLAHKIPKEPLIELLQGYEWDMTLDTTPERKIRFEEDLILYSRHVASSVAEMCMFIVDPDPQAPVVLAAREMGVVLQLTNVARDILTDANHGRVYVPEAWFDPGHLELLHEAGKLPLNEITRSPLLKVVKPEAHALRLLGMADSMHKRSTRAIGELPEDCQVGIRIATDGYFAIGKHLEDICASQPYPLRARLSKRQKITLALHHLFSPKESEVLLLGGCLLRFLLILFGNWQDSLQSNVSYTDIDYKVFSDAARFVHAGGSPYSRATYRYTPLLAWLLIPGQYFDSWGKVVFAGGDIIAGWLMIRLLRKRGLSVRWAAIWLLNPMVAVISTRGNCEGLLGALAIGLLYSVETNHIVLSGLILGLAVHFKIYPIIYAPSVIWALETDDDPDTTKVSLILKFFNRRRLIFGITSFLTFALLSALMFRHYGMEFIQHTFLYHISRTDHRHNFSPYHLLLYLSSSPSIDLQISKATALVAFLPQMLLALIIIPLAMAKYDLTTCFLAQTFAFVAFNKVVTSQYFMWYMVFLPLYLPRSTLISKGGAACLLAWIVIQAVWLYYAYGFEMMGKNTFRGMWISSLLFFGTNIVILGEIVRGQDI